MNDLEDIRDNIKRIFETQGKIFDEIKYFREDFSKKQLECEKRFTKIEITNKVNTRWKKGLYNTLYVVFGGSFTLVGKWLMSKF